MARQYSTSDQEREVGLRFAFRLGETPHSPLVVLVHGRAGTRDVMWTFERSIPAGHAIVAFEAPCIDPIGGFSWWHLETAPSLVEAGDAAAIALISAIKGFESLFSITPQTRIALGFSQGGALLSVILQRNLIELSGLGLLASFVVDTPRHPDLRPRDVFVAHGTQDDIIRIDRARRGVKILTELGMRVVAVEDEVGHKVGINGMRGLKEWLERLAVATT